MENNKDQDELESKRNELAARLSDRGHEGYIAFVAPDDWLYKLEERLIEQEKNKRWTGQISFETEPPTPKYTWPPLQLDDIPTDPLRVVKYKKQHDKSLSQTTIKELESKLDEIEDSLNILYTHEGSDEQIANLEGEKNRKGQELKQKKDELSKLDD